MNIKEEFYIRTLEALIQHNGYYEGVEERALEITNRSFDVLGGVEDETADETADGWIKWDSENDDVPVFPEGTTIEWSTSYTTSPKVLNWYGSSLGDNPVKAYRIVK